jgi:mRNA capping enzyme, catalytic domain/mRNA capping enzyme, beta chain/mRNA capping enzyme, C-terminal domain
MSNSKRPGFDMKDLQAKKAKMDQQIASTTTSGGTRTNPYLSQPVQPEAALQIFLTQVRNAARRYLPVEQRDREVTRPFCEVEARLGILKVNHASPERRVTSSGAKMVNGKPARTFDCSGQKCSMLSGVSRSQFVRSTAAGMSEVSALSQALGVTTADRLKHELVETEMIETVYTGYANNGRVCFLGEHPSATAAVGKMESKEKLMGQDLTVPAANFDLRVSLSSEKIMDPAIQEPPPGWKSKRVKRRRSYTRRDKSIKWQIDVTEVTTYTAGDIHSVVDYEIEMELLPSVLLQLINENDDSKLKQMTTSLSQQLWWILSQINPLKDAVDVEETLRDHPNKKAVQVALAQCGALRKFMDNGCTNYDSPVGKSSPPAASLANVNFVGCMPVNFSRHNLEEIQRAPDNAYFLSEKTDGVRYFMVFTGDTVVLVDRAMRGKQPIPVGAESDEPFAPILDLIQAGTVLDGEVVMNRRVGRKPRPIFIVFDVLAVSTTEPVLQLPFEHRLRCLRQATFRTATAARDMFDAHFVADAGVALPLVRKNFVKRTDLDELLSHVVEERGMRCYRAGDLHNHLTDGIIFQPNSPYVCGTDVNLLKWKYLDTVTIDVEMLPLRHTDDDDALRVGCLGEEQTRVDMTRYVLLPKSERMRLEADKFEAGGRIAEVGFDPETGEWYYLTMRSDKIMPNHISTVLGTLLELAESLTTDELRYRMSVPAGTRDTYRKDMRGMLKQLLEHQRRRLQSQRPVSNGTR